MDEMTANENRSNFLSGEDHNINRYGGDDANVSPDLSLAFMRMFSTNRDKTWRDEPKHIYDDEWDTVNDVDFTDFPFLSSNKNEKGKQVEAQNTKDDSIFFNLPIISGSWNTQNKRSRHRRSTRRFKSLTNSWQRLRAFVRNNQRRKMVLDPIGSSLIG